MKSPLGVLLFSFGLLYVLFMSYIVWLKPKHYMDHLHKRRSKLKLLFPFLPDWLLGFIFFYEQPKFSTWWARFWMIISLLICILGIVAAVHGPF